MRFWCVLLGLLTMTLIRVSSGDCSNGVAGVQASNVCCEPQCEMCGGEGCSQQQSGEEACCTAKIRDNGDLCSTTLEAPCIIDETLCSNGFAGVQASDVCCEAQCGTCGGSGCSQRPGGMGACCANTIRGNERLCSTTLAAPCIVDAVCDNGVPGVQAGNVCCEAQCEICGGSGCSQRPGGMDACCTDTIRANDEMCSTTMEAPCILDG